MKQIKVAVLALLIGVLAGIGFPAEAQVTNAIVIQALEAMGLFGTGYANGQVPAWSTASRRYLPATVLSGLNPVFTGQMTGPTNNTCVAPTYSATGQTGTGMSISTTPSVLLGVSGTCRFTLTATSLTLTVPTLEADGTAAAVAYGFTGFPGTGWYRGSSTGRLIGSVAGTAYAAIDASTGFIAVRSDGFLGFLSGTAPDTNGLDTIAAREAANYWIFRNGTTAQRFSVANTYTSASNNELFSVDWQTTANVVRTGLRTAATGTGHTMQLVAQTDNAADIFSMVQLTAASLPIVKIGYLNAAAANNSNTAAGTWFSFGNITHTGTSGSVINTAILPTYNQSSGTAANTDLLINRTQTAVGSGAQLLIDAQVGSVTRFNVSNVGDVVAARDINSTRFFVNQVDGSGGGYLGGTGNDVAWYRGAANAWYTGSGDSINVNAATLQFSAVVADSATAPSIASGGCTSPAITHNNGTVAFLITIGSSCSTVKTLTLTMPAAAHFWACSGNNNTSDAQQVTNYPAFRATSTTAVVLTSYDRVLGVQEDFTAADTYLVQCRAE